MCKYTMSSKKKLASLAKGVSHKVTSKKDSPRVQRYLAAIQAKLNIPEENVVDYNFQAEEAALAFNELSDEEKDYALEQMVKMVNET